MKSRPRLFFLSLTFLSVVQTPAQQSSQAPPRRDPQALAILSQTTAATGWSQVGANAGFVAKAVVTYGSGDTANVLIKARGESLIRVDIQAATSNSTTIINGDQGVIIGPSGTQRLPPHTVASMRPLMLPFLSYWVRFSDEKVGLRDLGAATVREEPCQKIQITRQTAPGDLAAAARQRSDALVVYISVQTALPVEINHNLISPENSSAVFTVADYLSDYRVVGNIAVPFRIDEFQDGRLLHSFQFTEFQADTSITDSDFALPATL